LLRRFNREHLCDAREAGVAHLCVVNDADPRWKTTRNARDYLLAADVPVADA
jgi:hypothetical protein